MRLNWKTRICLDTIEMVPYRKEYVATYHGEQSLFYLCLLLHVFTIYGFVVQSG